MIEADAAVPDANTASAPFELRAGALRLAVRPDLGGAVAGLWHGETPILRSTEPGRLASAREAAMFPLVPYSNRLGYRRFRWRGRDHTTRANVADSPHSLHGVGWQRPWRIVSSSALEVVLELRHAADADWPFAFSARQYLALDAASFSARLQLANDDARRAAGRARLASVLSEAPRSRMHIELRDRWDSDRHAIADAQGRAAGHRQPMSRTCSSTIASKAGAARRACATSARAETLLVARYAGRLHAARARPTTASNR